VSFDRDRLLVDEACVEAVMVLAVTVRLTTKRILAIGILLRRVAEVEGCGG